MNNPNLNPMVVSDPLSAFEKEGMLKVIAPAKMNLLLAIGKKRNDGYHDATTVMHALSLHDVLHVDYYAESAGGLEVDVSCAARETLDPFEILSDENLATQAIRFLAEKLGRSSDERIVIRIEKHIPLQAGLGGGSSDAAAALVAAAHLWNTDVHSDAVLSVAERIGSDVRFFLHGGCAYLTGTGEEFQHALTPMKKTVALIKPNGGISTSQAYQAFDQSPSPVPKEVLDQALIARDASNVPLFNNLSDAAKTLLPELSQIDNWAKSQEGVEDILLSGSGSATVAICDSFDSARHIAAAAKARGWWARTTSFSSMRASIVPKR